MAVIQLRSGAYEDYDPTKMHAAEMAVILSGDPATDDGKSLNISFGAGDSKRVLTEGEIPEVDDELSSLSENPVQNNVIKSALDLKAAKASPAFTGSPTAPTPATSDRSTNIATTAFVRNAIGAYAAGSLIVTDLGSGVVELSLGGAS